MGDTIQCFTDGACSGNPGPGGFGVIIKAPAGAGVLSYEYSMGYKFTTNNRMELMAVIFALEHVKEGSVVEVTTDSEYVVNAVVKGWLNGWLGNGWKTASKKEVKNRDLWLRFLDASKDKKVKLTWIKGHNSHPDNERCDELAVKAYGKRDLMDDIGYEEVI